MMYVAVGALVLVALLLLFRPRHDAIGPDSVSAERWQHVPPVGDPMPVKRPTPGVDTSMPVIHVDTAGRAHLPASPPPPRR